jgi:serine/threonine protein phosphatase PrpC
MMTVRASSDGSNETKRLVKMRDIRNSADYEFGSACDVGRKRRGEPNQDALEVILPPHAEAFPPLLLVADGLGGHVGGATASRLVIEVFKEQYLHTKHPADYPQLLNTCLRKAHMAVRVQGAQDEKLAHMGSTVVAVVLEGNRAHMLNVGDSRAYIIRRDRMLQISQDQSWVGDQVRAGLLSREQARGHPKSNRLNMAITAKRASIEPFTASHDLEPDDILVLCSDGLWGPVPETLIWASASELRAQEAADKLVSLANANRGPDNISVIVAKRLGAARRAVSADLEDTNPGE